MSKQLYEEFQLGKSALFLIVRDGANMGQLDRVDIFFRKEGNNNFSLLLWSSPENAGTFKKTIAQDGWNISEITWDQFSKFYFGIPDEERSRLAIRIT